ncbi:carnitine acetyl transferase [Histoplasma capsulatum G186AR]|uniref:Carnitine acetyl transferase n=1 Tax=Ajellomyces capsulatus (strain G186AR / H82 / ATCC MYA-2454 / RMSCC 2432) TaxID=447093 RepID=C0NK80_AJECG|nr:carnitine acetyl transferase [Histoplasma capsulatum G186AR]EEH08271.1 carnitine acetyl transferase [Histoplasma capsulatum G186AR]
MAVRFFTTPKPLGETLAENENSRNPKSPNGISENKEMSQSAMAAADPTNSTPKSHPPEKVQNGITFANQDSLPKLPIPDLESTCNRYLECLAPLQSAREQEETKAAVNEFLKTDGPELQNKLKNYATSKSSYIEQFSVVLNLNPFFLLEDDPTPSRNNQVTRAASLVVSALSFVRAVRREELAPDTVRGKPLCMFQYSRLFGTARVPTENGCIIGQDSAAKHMVVLCRGQFYWFDVLDDNNDLLMSERDISLNLQVIIEDAEQTPIQEAAKGALGVLSTENRKVWSGLRDILTKDRKSNNAECLNIVDTALFVLCLDSTEPSNTAELCANMLCGTNEVVRGVQIGTCTNRWYDKLQIIVCKNGSAGINFEHTGVDGHTVLRFASDVYTDTILRFARTINGQAPSLWATTSPPPSKRSPESFASNVSTTPHKLEWDMGPELSIALRFAESHLADLLHQHEFQVLDFKGYGKNFITSMSISPDAFVQMAFQAAYYGLYGRVENTYEPAMTKFFLHGRTEAVRTVSHESVEFVRTFWDERPAAEKVAALRKATEKHTATTKTCSQGKGQDRHLYALYCLWQRSFDDGLGIISSGPPSTNGYSSPAENGSSIDSSPAPAHGSTAVSRPSSPSDDGISSSYSTSSSRNIRLQHLAHTPALFNDAGWDKINTTILSTSNCGNPSLRHFGFGPTSGDGFGIGYIIKDDSISICASSKHRQTTRFIQSLEAYLYEIRKLLRATQRKPVGPSSVRERQMDAESPTAPVVVAPGERVKGRGRLVRVDPQLVGGAGTVETPTTDSGDVEDDGMGGYGFFDAGMLLHALKGLQADRDRDKPPKRKLVGKVLKLNEY